jgi:hypothetical protein
MTIIDEEEDAIELPTGNKSNVVSNVVEKDKKSTNERVIHAMKKLESWFNPQATKVTEDYTPGRETLLEQFNLALFTTYFVKEPSSFVWKEAIDKELNEMTKKCLGSY